MKTLIGAGLALAFGAGVPHGDAMRFFFERISAEEVAVRSESDPKIAYDLTETANGAFSFHVRVPEGNYRVRALIGGSERATATTVESESRRLMVRDVVAAAGETVAVEFVANVRTPVLEDGREVLLNDREIGVWHWDDRLTLTFSGENPAVASLEIAPTADAVTVYLAGDSTVTDQPREPWAGWGQRLPQYFGLGVAVANHAESGASLRSFHAQRRFEKMFEQLRANDYVFVQFGHNDQKERGDGIGPFASYAEDLRKLAGRIRERGAYPVFVTSMYRRRFRDGRMYDTLGDYPVAMRRVAREEGIPLIDLHAGSRRIFEALGEEGSKRAFVHFPANTFPGQESALKDDTHFTSYGADLLADFVVEGIREHVPELAAFLVEGDGGRPERPDLSSGENE